MPASPGCATTCSSPATRWPRQDAPDGFFGTLNDMAASVPAGAHGVLFTPWLNGERSPVDDHTIRGGFHNISLSSTRADMVRAVFEGVALNSAWLLGAVEKFCKRRVRLAGLRRRWRQLGPVVPDARRRHGPDHPPDRRSGAGQRARRRAADPARPRPHDARRHPGHRRGEGDLRARPGRSRALRRAAEGVRQPLREDEGHPQAAERAPLARRRRPSADHGSRFVQCRRARRSHERVRPGPDEPFVTIRARWRW